MLHVLIWWLVLQLIGLLALPITLKLLRFLPDRGYGFARHVGLLLSGYLFWLLVSFGVLQNTTANIVFVLLLVGGLSTYLWAREGKGMRAALQENRRVILVTEVLFFLALAGFALFRAYNPDIAATEKPMEFGFINAILRSRTFPPRDPWLSGYGISYYYLGYIISAMLTRLSGLPSDITFNLTGVMLFALTMNGAFSVVCNLAQATLDHRAQVAGTLKKVGSWASILSGFLGAILVALMGNLEGVFELIRVRGGGSEALWRWLDVKNLHATPPSTKWYPDDLWWWWRASRVIHDRDAMGKSMEVIDEFPFFSFLLGDNHPHVLTLPFVLLALALALNLLLAQAQKAKTESPQEEQDGGRFARLARSVADLWSGGPFDWVMWGILLGGLGFLNTWDYPIYFGIFVLAYAVQRQAYRKVSWEWLADVITFGGLLFTLGVLLYFPFYLGFRSQAGGIGMVGEIKTRLHQYLLMLGVFVFAVTSLLVALLIRYRRLADEMRRLPLLGQLAGGVMALLFLFSLVQGWWTAALIWALAAGSTVTFIWGARLAPADEGGAMRLEPSTSFALLLITTGLLLTVFVEFLFLRDTFGTRMNTVFKFYYQAWVLLGIASAYGAFYILHRLRAVTGWARGGLALWSLVGIVLVGAGLSYTVAATTSKAGGFGGEPTLDGTRYIARFRKDDYDAIRWLRANAPPDGVMLEAPGGSYSEYNWVSAHTGIPTLLGWGGHELQWRGNYDEPSRREPDISAIYQGGDVEQTQNLLEKYGIDCVYVGHLEREKYHVGPATLRKFDRLMTRVYENSGVIIYGYGR